jgi:hypothetical protein
MYNFYKIDFQRFYIGNENNKRIAFLMSLNDTSKENYPPIYFVRTMINILNCYSSIDWGKIDIIFIETNLIFRLYIWVLRVYIPIHIWNQIVYYKDFNEVKKNFDLSKDDLNFSRYFL